MVALIGLVVAALTGTTAVVNAAPSMPPVAAVASTASAAPAFGPNVKIFDPSMSTASIQAVVDGISAQQIDNEMGTQRYSLLFKPGVYGSAAAPLVFQVGYYTEVAGLGASPTDVTINGQVDVFNRCITPDNCIALNNFWRSISNLTINVATPASATACRKTGEFWAVSQSSPMRRVNINGNLTLMDYCTNGPQWASGGFIADSRTGTVTNGSQQQFLVRNSRIGTWSNGVWNQVFAGVQGAPAQNFATTTTDPATGAVTSGTYTTLATTPNSREKPFFYVDQTGNYAVYAPGSATNSSGITWQSGQTPGRSIPLSSFFLASPSNSVATINAALAGGKNLLLTPGVYSVDQSIQINRADTVVLGMGIATLTSVNGAVPVAIGDVKGVVVAGVMIDAGTVNAPALMTIGSAHAAGAAHCGSCSSSADPTTLNDVFFRIGGPHVGKATLGLVVNSDNVILDDIWSWRADHGVAGSVGWTVNTSDTGLVVNGDNVTATGLFVEHFEKYNVIWNGQNGKTVFFQNEMPYDPPNQAAWEHNGVLGYAAYKVADSVKSNELWGGGSYIYTNIDPSIHATRAFEVPVTAGVTLHDLLTVQLLAGLIDHVVNNTGAVTPGPVAAPSFVVDFPAGSGPPPTTVTTPTTSATVPTTPTTATTPTTPTTPTTRTTPTTSTTSTTGGIGGMPSNLHATTTSTSVTLLWSGDPGASYDILRGGVKIASTTGNSYTDSGLNLNTPYLYSVRGTGGTTPQITVVLGAAQTTASTSTTSSTATTATTVTTAATVTAGPGTPSNLRKSGQTASTITLAWNGSSTATYDILRGEAGDRIATVTGNSFTDVGLLANTPYVYSVRGAGGTTPQITVTIS